MLGERPSDESRDSLGNPNAPASAPAVRRRRFAQEAKSLANSMFEAKAMSLHVVERLEAIMDAVEASPLESAAFVGARLEKIAKEYCDFLARFHGKKTVFRLVCNRAVVSQSLKFHDDLDNLLRGLGATEDSAAWRPRWEGYRDAQQAAFEKVGKSRIAEEPNNNEWDADTDDACSSAVASAAHKAGGSLEPGAADNEPLGQAQSNNVSKSSESDSAEPPSGQAELHEAPNTPVTPPPVYLRSAAIRGFAILASGNKGVEYRVDLRLSDGSTIQVERRYSELRSLYKVLSARHQQEMAALPRFPSRKLLWSRNLDAIANERLASLSSFVESVAKSATLAVGVRLRNNETLRKEGLEADVVM
ncbi:hypothetical protein PybrP1_009152 [[Pythium] brassicae (nom. inval.)]|nr:hypothetical protein PybrP1_009152 [[Pythium] brassicae (nom. inval.)]